MKKTFFFLLPVILVYLTGPAWAGEDCPRKKSLLQTVMKPDYPDHACGVIGVSDFQRKVSRDQTYRLFRGDDLNRDNPVGTLELIDGSGFIYPLRKLSPDELLVQWGKARDGRSKQSITLPEIPAYYPRIFDLVALDSDSQPIFFHIRVTFKNGVADQYTVDGPGIQKLEYKLIK